MSNKIVKIFLLIFLCLLSLANLRANNSEQLAEANQYFEAALYEKSVAIYEEIYAKGYFQEDMLYQMAFSFEQLQNLPKSIYYLRKAQWEYGNALTDSKISQLVEEMGTSRVIVSTEWSNYHAFLHRSYSLWLLVLAGILGAAAWLFWQNRNPRFLIGGIGLSAIGVFMALLLIEHTFISPDHGVIISDTSFYEMPAYTSTSKEIPVSPGTLIHIKAKQDIWYFVAIGHYECWIPEFVVMKL